MMPTFAPRQRSTSLSSAFGLGDSYGGPPVQVPMLGTFNDHTPHPSFVSRMAPAGQPGGMFGSMEEGLAALQGQNAFRASRDRQPMPAYSQQLQSGAMPFSNPALGSRYAAANQRLANAQQPFDMPPLFSGQAAQQQATDFYNMAHPGYQPFARTAAPERDYRNMSDADRERVASFGGVYRPFGVPGGSVGPPTQEDAAQIDRSAVAKAQLNLAINRRRDGFTPSPGGMSPQEQYDMRQFQGRQAQRAAMATPAERAQGVRQNAIDRADARRARLGIGDPTDLFLQQNPMLALQHGMMQQQLGLQGMHEANAHQRGLLHEQNLAGANTAKAEQAKSATMAAFIGALPQLVQGGHITPEQAEQAMASFHRQMFGGGAGAAGGQGAAQAGPTGTPRTSPLKPHEKSRLQPFKQDPESVVAELERMGYQGEHLNRELNKLYGGGLFGFWSRTGKHPRGQHYGYVDAQGGEHRTIIGHGIDALRSAFGLQAYGL